MAQKTLTADYAPTKVDMLKIKANFDELYAADTVITTNTEDIATNAEDIVTNAEDIATNGGNISTNEDNITAINAGTIVYSHRQRVLIADVNAGATLLAAITGKYYRLVSCKAIAYGGAVGTVTTIDIMATQSAGAVILVSYAQAGLTQSSVLTDGDTSSAVLADGASYIANDITTAITIIKAGTDADTATGVDIILEYTIE